MIRFGTGGWRAVIGDEFTRASIRRLAAALARRMGREGCAEKGIVLGYDRRFLSREACIWFAEVLAGEGVRVHFVNLNCPTPQIMFAVKSMGLSYGALVTASHNPAIYNGIKIFTLGGRDASEDVTGPIQEEANALEEESIREADFDRALKDGRICYIDPRDDYLDSILARIDTDAVRRRRLRVVLDPMFGTGLNGLATILYTCRCDVDVINDRHDAFFGRHLPAPTPETLTDLRQAVLEHNANVGIATDGDADRLGIIDENGDYVSPNEILVLLYRYLLEYKGWRGPAVRNIATTHLLDRVAESFGQECLEVPVGFKHISSAMERCDALIGGESSGGLTVRGHIRGKDGLYAAGLFVEMLSVTGKSIGELTRDLYDKYGEMHTAEFDWALTPEDRDRIRGMIFDDKKLPEFRYPVKRVNYADGCKIYFEKAWVIIRFSGTEPRVRIFAEDDTIHHAKTLVGMMADFAGLPFDA